MFTKASSPAWTAIQAGLLGRSERTGRPPGSRSGMGRRGTGIAACVPEAVLLAAAPNARECTAGLLSNQPPASFPIHAATAVIIPATAVKMVPITTLWSLMNFPMTIPTSMVGVSVLDGGITPWCRICSVGWI